MGKGGKHMFRDYFMLPVQRVLKYHILLEALKKETPEVNGSFIIHSKLAILYEKNFFKC